MGDPSFKSVWAFCNGASRVVFEIRLDSPAHYLRNKLVFSNTFRGITPLPAPAMPTPCTLDCSSREYSSGKI